MNNINGTTTRYNLLTDTRKLVHRKKYQTLVTYHEIQASRIQQSWLYFSRKSIDSILIFKAK